MISMTDCMNELTGSDMATLEKIVTLQYRKFIEFYRLISKYEDDIKELKYEFNSSSSLDVSLFFKNKEFKNLKNELEKSMGLSGYNGHIKLNSKCIYVSIVMDEDN